MFNHSFSKWLTMEPPGGAEVNPEVSREILWVEPDRRTERNYSFQLQSRLTFPTTEPFTKIQYLVPTSCILNGHRKTLPPIQYPNKDHMA